ncbi:MAG: TetR/AcrR family transcriptional regulator C-terminal domain-containing protein [Sphaerochaetaceae bacterium]|nr:TetR/AcrR family transcriptional regulator C-terminal domain-containing protein [Sphaerochaetaceae bacterium]
METKLQFALSIKALMKNQSLDKISVSSICKESNLTRQTFYRNFKDKYDLVNWYFQQLCDKSFFLMGVKLNLYEALCEKFKFIENEKIFFSQAFKSDDYNNLKNYDFEMIYKFYENAIIQQTKKPLSEDLSFLLEMYCKGSIDMTSKWATGYLDLSKEKMVNLLIKSVPEELKKYLIQLNKTKNN